MTEHMCIWDDRIKVHMDQRTQVIMMIWNHRIKVFMG